MIWKQVGAGLVALFIFFAFVAAMSRLLTLPEGPSYIDNVTGGIANLFSGVFNQAPSAGGVGRFATPSGGVARRAN